MSEGSVEGEVQGHITRAMFPASKVHEVFEFRGTVARVLRTPDLNCLRTRLAPRVAAPAKRADDGRRLLVLTLVDEDGCETPWSRYS